LAEKLAELNSDRSHSEGSQKEQRILDDIEDFINKLSLSTEEMILRQIYPSFFLQRMREKYFADQQQNGEDSEAEVKTQAFMEKFSEKYDQKESNYVTIRKDFFLEDVK